MNTNKNTNKNKNKNKNKDEDNSIKEQIIYVVRCDSNNYINVGLTNDL